MDNITNTIQPDYELVEWAEKMGYYIAHPKDRAWYFVECCPPNGQPKSWECSCFCAGLPDVRLRRYLCESGTQYCYIGQCRNCERIFWNHVEVKE